VVANKRGRSKKVLGEREKNATNLKKRSGDPKQEQKTKDQAQKRS